MTVAEQFAVDQQRQFLQFAQDSGEEEEPMQSPEEKLETQKEMYSLTIEALLNFSTSNLPLPSFHVVAFLHASFVFYVDASIAAASAKSGKSLYELMNVTEKWYVLSSEIQDIAKAEFVLEDEYFDVVAHPQSTLEDRRKKKQDWVCTN